MCHKKVDLGSNLKKILLGEEIQTSQALIFLVTIQVFIMIGTRPCIGR